jgi:thiol:disulfide interchange protein
MKKIILSGIVAIALIAAVSAFNYSNKTQHKTEETKGSGMVFQTGTLQEALDLAKKENKLVFVDFYTTWCGPCKLLKKNTFSNESVGTYYNEKFINITIDAEKGEGIDLAKKYNVIAYPTLIFLDSDGNMKHQALGYKSHEEFLELGQSVIAKN